MTKIGLLRGGIAIALTMGALAVGTAVAGQPRATIEFKALEDVTWTPLMKGPLPATAPIHGDASKGTYEGYLKLPAGFVSPPHSHTSDYWAVLVQGKMTHWATEGGSEREAKQLAAGDLTHMPGKLDHISKCFPGQDCIMVIIQPGKFDFVPGGEKK